MYFTIFAAVFYHKLLNYSLKTEAEINGFNSHLFTMTLEAMNILSLLFIGFVKLLIQSSSDSLPILIAIFGFMSLISILIAFKLEVKCEDNETLLEPIN